MTFNSRILCLFDAVVTARPQTPTCSSPGLVTVKASALTSSGSWGYRALEQSSLHCFSLSQSLLLRQFVSLLIWGMVFPTDLRNYLPV